MSRNARSDAARVREMTRRILQCWESATAEDLADGLAWYARAGEVADALAAGAPISRETGAGVIAALSPRCGWGPNVRGATAMVDAFAAGHDEPVVAGTRSNRSKAWAILQGAGSDPLEVLGGPKVRAFYANICGDINAVTVDVWAARVAEGRDNPNAPTGKRYKLIARAYQRAAEIVGHSPRDVQAACWVHYRRVHARALFD